MQSRIAHWSKNLQGLGSFINYSLFNKPTNSKSSKKHYKLQYIIFPDEIATHTSELSTILFTPTIDTLVARIAAVSLA